MNAKDYGAQRTISLILKVIPLAMGVSVAVGAFIGEMDVNSALILLGIGLTLLSIGELNEIENR